MRILPGNAQHIGARRSQQDSFGFADPNDREFLAHGGFLAVICDGMGGMEHGEAASRAAVRAFLDAYQRKTPEESIPEALERGVFEANREVLALADRLGLVENMGTTLVAAALTGGAMYYVSVGDSGLFVVSGGRYRMVNRPHVFANLLDRAVARGVMSRADAEGHPERDSLTSFIGAEKLEEIDRNLEPYPLPQGDAILLATDGMFKTLDEQEIQACLYGAPQSWPEALVALTMAKHREYQDNVTVLSVAVEDGEGPSAPVRVKERPLALDEKRTVLIPHVPAAPPVSAAPPAIPDPARSWSPAAQIPPIPLARSRRSRFSSRTWLILAILSLAAAIAGAAAGYRWGALHRVRPPVQQPVEQATPPAAPPARQAGKKSQEGSRAGKPGAKPNPPRDHGHEGQEGQSTP